MAQRYQDIFQPITQDNYYSHLTEGTQELGYQPFVTHDANQIQSQTPSYPYEHVHPLRLQQAAHPYYALQNNHQFDLPAQPTVMYQTTQKIIPRKNRSIPFPFPNNTTKRLRIDAQAIPAQQSYQTNTDTQSQQFYFQQMSQLTPQFPVESPCLTSIIKYPLDTASPTNSSPSRSPILNTSQSPTNTREPLEEVKCSHLRHQPFTPAPITQACYRPSNLRMYTSPMSTFTPVQAPAEPDTSPLPLERRDTGAPHIPVNNRQQPQAEILDTILIQDEEDPNTVESEIVIVSVKSATIPAPDLVSSPLILSPQATAEDPDVTLNYEAYPPRSVPVQQVHMPQSQTPPAIPVNNIAEQSQFFSPEYEYPFQNTPPSNYITPVQPPLYFAIPHQTTEPYNIPVYPRPGTPNPFYAYPQQMMTRASIQNTRRMVRPYEYPVPSYQPVSYHPANTHLQDFIPYEEPPFVLHPVQQTHTPSRPKKQGLTKAELKRLKVKKFKLADSKEKDDSCVICMDEYKEGDRLYVLACNHEYHKDCVKDWLVKQRNCPLCRKEVHP